MSKATHPSDGEDDQSTADLFERLAERYSHREEGRIFELAAQSWRESEDR